MQCLLVISPVNGFQISKLFASPTTFAILCRSNAIYWVSPQNSFAGVALCFNFTSFIFDNINGNTHGNLIRSQGLTWKHTKFAQLSAFFWTF